MTASTFVNLGFEDADPTTAGVPNGWAWSHRVTSFKIAGFGSRPSRFEDFEWIAASFVFALDDSNREQMRFVTARPTPQTVEDFERLWQNDQQLRTLDNAVAAVFIGAAAPHAFEDFEHAWAGNSDFVTVFNDASLGVAMFEPLDELFEDFDLGWRANEDFLFVFAPTNLSSALFVNGAQAFESFEVVKFDISFVWMTGTQRVNAPGHLFVEGDLVTFYALGDGLSALPGGIVPTRRYRVHSPTVDDFLVQDEFGTSAVTATDAGTGSIFVKADMRSHWTTSMDA